METYKVLLAILDFVPVVIFFAATMKLQKIFFDLMSKHGFAMLVSGSFMILIAGLLKALWKIFYYSSNGSIDLFKFNHQMFPILAIGYLTIFASMISTLIGIKKRSKKGSTVLKSVVPFTLILMASSDLTPYVGKEQSDPGFFVYLVVLTIGTLGFYTLIGVICFKNKKVLHGIFVILAAIFALGMTALAVKIEGDNLWLNFVAEMVNTLGQLMFLFSVIGIQKIGKNPLTVFYKNNENIQ